MKPQPPAPRIPAHEQYAPPPRPYHNPYRYPTFGEILPEPLDWEQWQESRARDGNLP